MLARTLILLVLLPFICAPIFVQGVDAGPPPAFESSVTDSQTSGTSMPGVGYPSGSAEGDWIVIGICVNGNNRNPQAEDDQTVPENWTQVEMISGAGKTIALLERRIGAGEDFSGVSIYGTWTTSSAAALVAIRISGSDTAVTSSSTNGTASPVTFTSVTTTQSNSVVVAISCQDSTATWTSPPTSYTTVAQVTSTVTASLGYREMTTSGAETPGDVTLSATIDWQSAVGGYE